MRAARITSAYHKFINSVSYLFYRDPIVITAWVNIRYGRIVPHNWGDDINIYLLELITGRKIIVKNQSLYHSRYYNGPVYNCIGSTIGWYETCKTIIWGSGIIKNGTKLDNTPMKVCSVRGLETRKQLQRQGIECPCKYGDPALLISKYYQPQPSQKRYKLGIIPHYTELGNPLIKQFLSKHKNDVLLIDMANYKKWTDIPDKITSCDCIISSSLHGLIVADSYSVPNIWVTFSNLLYGGDFKFIDYFSSVKRTEVKTYISTLEDLENIYTYPNPYNNAIIDYTSIASSAPFHLKDFVYIEDFGKTRTNK